MMNFAFAFFLLFTASSVASNCGQCDTTSEKTVTFSSMCIEDCHRMRKDFEEVVASCSKDLTEDERNELMSFIDELIKVMESASEQIKELENKHKSVLEKFNTIMKEKEQAQSDAMVNELLANEEAMTKDNSDCLDCEDNCETSDCYQN